MWLHFSKFVPIETNNLPARWPATIAHRNKQSSKVPLFNYSKSVPFINRHPPISPRTDKIIYLDIMKYIRQMALSISIFFRASVLSFCVRLPIRLAGTEMYNIFYCRLRNIFSNERERLFVVFFHSPLSPVLFSIPTN